MADSSYYDDGPFKRNQWNALISDINKLLANPPSDTDCEPIAPLELVKPEHIWTVKDVETVREKLQETCSTMTFSEELKIWRKKIIDEIEEQMGDMWCDCEDGPPACTYQCPNAGSDAESSLGAFYAVNVQEEKVEIDPCDDNFGHYITDNCTIIPFESRIWPAAAYPTAKAARDAFGRASKAAYRAISLRVSACAHGAAAEDFQEEIDALQDLITQLAQSKALACADPEDNVYFCNIATQELADAQEDLTAAQASLAAESAAYASGLAEADAEAAISASECQAGNNLMSAYINLFPGLEQSLMFLWSSKASVSTASYASIYTIANLRAGTLADNCWPTWSIHVVGDGTEENPNTVVNSGTFTPDGAAIGMGVGGFGWYGVLLLHRPAGDCPIGYFPFILHSEEGTRCFICTGGGNTCRDSCDIDGCRPSDLAALYTEYGLTIRLPEPRGEICPEPVPEIEYDENGDPIPPDDPTPSD